VRIRWLSEPTILTYELCLICSVICGVFSLGRSPSSKMLRMWDFCTLNCIKLILQTIITYTARFSYSEYKNLFFSRKLSHDLPYPTLLVHKCIKNTSVYFQWHMSALILYIVICNVYTQVDELSLVYRLMHFMIECMIHLQVGIFHSRNRLCFW